MSTTAPWQLSPASHGKSLDPRRVRDCILLYSARAPHRRTFFDFLKAQVKSFPAHIGPTGSVHLDGCTVHRTVHPSQASFPDSSPENPQIHRKDRVCSTEQIGEPSSTHKATNCRSQDVPRMETRKCPHSQEVLATFEQPLQSSSRWTTSSKASQGHIAKLSHRTTKVGQSKHGSIWKRVCSSPSSRRQGVKLPEPESASTHHVSSDI